MSTKVISVPKCSSNNKKYFNAKYKLKRPLNNYFLQLILQFLLFLDIILWLRIHRWCYYNERIVIHMKNVIKHRKVFLCLSHLSAQWVGRSNIRAAQLFALMFRALITCSLHLAPTFAIDTIMLKVRFMLVRFVINLCCLNSIVYLTVLLLFSNNL